MSLDKMNIEDAIKRIEELRGSHFYCEPFQALGGDDLIAILKQAKVDAETVGKLDIALKNLLCVSMESCGNGKSWREAFSVREAALASSKGAGSNAE